VPPIGLMNLTFPLFRLFGIQVRIHWFFPLLVVMYVLRGQLEGGPLLMGFYGALMAGLVVTTLLHELGHCFAARSVGGHADEILLWPLGGLAYVGHGGAPRDDIKVALWGPLTHLPMAGICAGILALLGMWQWSFLNVFETWFPFYPLGTYFWQNFAVGFFKLQLILFFFNLLVPAYPLDGGRILTNILLIRYGRSQAAIVTTYFSIPIGVAILIWGFLQRDFLFGLLGIWVLYEAWQIRRLASMGEIDAHPMFAAAPEYDYMPDRGRPEKRKGWWARWREKRARAAMAREAEQQVEMRAKVDEVLDKVSREGIGSLSPAEKKILDDASRRGRSE
jgi:stage IV sporulation protein FB